MRTVRKAGRRPIPYRVAPEPKFSAEDPMSERSKFGADATLENQGHGVVFLVCRVLGSDAGQRVEGLLHHQVRATHAFR